MALGFLPFVRSQVSVETKGCFVKSSQHQSPRTDFVAYFLPCLLIMKSYIPKIKENKLHQLMVCGQCVKEVGHLPLFSVLCHSWSGEGQLSI